VIYGHTHKKVLFFIQIADVPNKTQSLMGVNMHNRNSSHQFTIKSIHTKNNNKVAINLILTGFIVQ
jgi:hypothetical protein